MPLGPTDLVAQAISKIKRTLNIYSRFDRFGDGLTDPLRNDEHRQQDRISAPRCNDVFGWASVFGARGNVMG